MENNNVIMGLIEDVNTVINMNSLEGLGIYRIRLEAYDTVNEEYINLEVAKDSDNILFSVNKSKQCGNYAINVRRDNNGK